jgi:broad specificity phosphatase PhoE
LSPAHEPALAEYDFGAWNGLLVAELRARGFWDAVKRDAEFSPPGGEPFGAAARRVGDALRRIASRHPGERAVVVGHGLSLAAALGATLDGDSRQAPRYALANAGIVELAFNERVQLVHLDPVID